MSSQPPPLNWMGMLMVAALLRMGYELSRPIPAGHKDSALLLPTISEADPPEEEWSSLLPWQRRASKKAVENYAAVQESKWRRWNEAMFEPDGSRQGQQQKPSVESI